VQGKQRKWRAWCEGPQAEHARASMRGAILHRIHGWLERDIGEYMRGWESGGVPLDDMSRRGRRRKANLLLKEAKGKREKVKRPVRCFGRAIYWRDLLISWWGSRPHPPNFTRTLATSLVRFTLSLDSRLPIHSFLVRLPHFKNIKKPSDVYILPSLFS
jgi:hypothetical protein